MAEDIMMIEARYPRINAISTVDCEVNHPVQGWIPFTASPDDSEQYGRELYAELIFIADPYVAPEPLPAPVPQSVTRFQARAALHLAGLLDQVETAITAGSVLDQIAWADASMFKRSSPLLASMALKLGLTDTQVDELFITAAEIEA